MGHSRPLVLTDPDDPKTFSRTWTFTTKPTLLKGELIEYICQENNKDVDHLVGAK